MRHKDLNLTTKDLKLRRAWDPHARSVPVYLVRAVTLICIVIRGAQMEETLVSIIQINTS